eukprot:scaffold85536_cov42-Phaeocystis_antarctica.AAC.1
MSCCPFSRASAASAAATSAAKPPSPPPPPPPPPPPLRGARCRSGLPLEPPLKREGERGPPSGERRARPLALVPPLELPPDSRPEEWRKGEGEPLEQCDGGVRGEGGERCKPSPQWPPRPAAARCEGDGERSRGRRGQEGEDEAGGLFPLEGDSAEGDPAVVSSPSLR